MAESWRFIGSDPDDVEKISRIDLGMLLLFLEGDILHSQAVQTNCKTMKLFPLSILIITFANSDAFVPTKLGVVQQLDDLSLPSPSLCAHSRREILVGGGLMANQILISKASAQEPITYVPQMLLPSSATLENGLLESRVLSNVLFPPPYGMEGSDIFYPE